MAEEWGPWIEHNYRKEPGAPLGAKVQAAIWCKQCATHHMSEGVVTNIADWSRVKKFRIWNPKPPKALEDLRRLVKNPRETEPA